MPDRNPPTHRDHPPLSGTELWLAALPSRALAKAERTVAWDAWVAAGRLHPTTDAAITAHEVGDRRDDTAGE